MSERTEYWWIQYEAEILPAAVGFVGGIPAHVLPVGAAERIPAAAVELLERLPAPPVPVFRKPKEAPPPPKQDRSSNWLWLFGILLLILISQCSGQLFDALK